MSLSDEQIERYSRQIILPEIGGHGQEVLLGSFVIVVGTGSEAARAVAYLAGAGIGRIGVFAGPDEPRDRATGVGDEARELNPDTSVSVHALPSSDRASEDWTAGSDVILCASDSTVERVVGDLAPFPRRPLVAGGVVGSTGWLSVDPAIGERAPCPLCTRESLVHETAPEGGDPLAAVATGVVGSLLAVESLKLCLPSGTAQGGAWHYDARTASLVPRPGRRGDDSSACHHRVAFRP